MLPCSACAKLKVACVVLDSKSRRYRSLNTLIKEEEKLKLEREAAFKVAVESIARINRLQKQLALV
jgi:hypothetical protein